MHALTKPMRDMLEAVYLAADMSVHHGMGNDKPWMMQYQGTDSVVFWNGRANMMADALYINLRVHHDLDFKFEVALGDLAPNGIETKRSVDGTAYIYFLKFDYNTPNLLDTVKELVSASIM